MGTRGQVSYATSGFLVYILKLRPWSTTGWYASVRKLKKPLKFGQTLIDMTSQRLTAAMAAGVEELSSTKSFRMFPVFWQVFLWSWGGFLLKDHLDEEYADVENETESP